ncbi:MAG: hypothetical protein JXA67_12015 [Micromonosporaceae bacterium]|nr:hypothetical protein [Micromonosporaceae bacterium]
MPHLVWEALLLVALLSVVILLTVMYPRLSSSIFWGTAAYSAMFAGALALSLRTATPNLAVTTIGAACGWWYVHFVNDGMPSILAWLVTLAVALGIGLLLGVLVGLTPLPAWAVSLVATSILSGSLLVGDADAIVALPQSPFAGTGVFLAWTLLFLLGSVAVAALLAVPSVRTAVGQNRSLPGAPAARLQGRLLGALIGLGVSSLLGGVGGVLFVLRIRAAQPFDGMGLTFALAAALLGGVSLLGRRGGLAGVAIAVLLLTSVQVWMSLEGASAGTHRLVLGVFALVGLGVNVLMERFGSRIERDLLEPAAPPSQPQFAGWPQQGTAWPQPGADPTRDNG